MPIRESYAPGEFCWVDLNSHDLEAAAQWYGELFGWSCEVLDAQGGPPYAMLKQDGHIVGGLGQMSDEMKAQGIPPCWNNYVQVVDCSATEAKARELGAQVTCPTMPVMDAGHLAFFMDPSGASFAIWQPGQHCGATLVSEPVGFAWNELATREVGQATEFYGQLFGWEFAEMPMGPITYTMIKNAGKDAGGVMPMEGPQWEGIPNHWMAYFSVADCDATSAKAGETGGSVKVPPTDIPVGRFSVIADPQGAVFSTIQMSQSHQ